MKISKFVLPAALIFSMASCGTGNDNLYSWDKYENATYNYTKAPSDKNLQELLKCYDKIITKQKAKRKVVPPGIYAEKAYILIGQGKKEEAISCLKQEIATYPESKLFIDKIIDQLTK